MRQLSKIAYYDLRLEAAMGRLPQVIGRHDESVYLERTLRKRMGGHAVITAPSGAGKTSFLLGFAKAFSQNAHFSESLIFIDKNSLQQISQANNQTAALYEEAFHSIKDAFLIIDDFGSLLQTQQDVHNWLPILQSLIENKNVKIILSMSGEELEAINRQTTFFKNNFETIKLPEQPLPEQIAILHEAAKSLLKDKSATIAPEVFEYIPQLAERFSSLGAMPKAGIYLLDEAIAAASLEAHAAANRPKTSVINVLLSPAACITKETITQVVSQKIGVPLKNLNQNEKEQLQMLPQALQEKIIGQEHALAAVSAVIQRARLGLKSQNRPLGSFLLLGPSGVGKTETAKTLSEFLYGKSEHFLRIDMSEFAESHSAARLIGSPPGYIGFEAGGQLTNHLKQHPYSLVLLDEIEKADAKIFDIFLQLLDDGRLTSGQGETVNATQSIIMATSNIGIEEIVGAFNNGVDFSDQNLAKELVLPKLLQHFRLEFLNRFDAILVYKPLSVENLTDIALLEIQKIEQRVKHHNIIFSFDRHELQQQLIGLADPRFGARPVKRFIEDLCEGLITKQLLDKAQ